MNINDYTKGWIVGDFTPSLIQNKNIEIAIKKYKSGDIEPKHYHKIATEYTIVLSGKVKMIDMVFGQDEIVEIKPNVVNQFECLEDCVLLVIKTPSVIGDKYELQ
jgi:quercetin dioxygenase-like cupin family protein